MQLMIIVSYYLHLIIAYLIICGRPFALLSLSFYSFIKHTSRYKHWCKSRAFMQTRKQQEHANKWLVYCFHTGALFLSMPPYLNSHTISHPPLYDPAAVAPSSPSVSRVLLSTTYPQASHMVVKWQSSGYFMLLISDFLRHLCWTNILLSLFLKRRVQLFNYLFKQTLTLISLSMYTVAACVKSPAPLCNMWEPVLKSWLYLHCWLRCCDNPALSIMIQHPLSTPEDTESNELEKHRKWPKAFTFSAQMTCALLCYNARWI